MVVLIDCLSSVSGGAASYLRNLGPLLSDRFEEPPEGHCLKLLAHEEQRPLLQTIPDSRCIWMHGKRLGGYRRVLWERMNLPRITREQRVDVLFTPYQITPAMPGLRQVLVFHNMEPFRLRRDYSYTLKSLLRNHLLRAQSVRCLRRADRVIAVSDYTRDCAVKDIGLSADRVVRVHHGRNLEFRPEGDGSTDRALLSRIGVEGDYVLTCGSLLPYRRCEDVVAAFGRCARELGECTQLVVAGGAVDARYASVIANAVRVSGVADRVLLAGHVDPKTMQALYRRSLACVLATEIEACPFIAIEAMASGCATVASDCAPLPEMFADACLTYPARDVGALAQGLRAVARDVVMREDLRRRALLRAQDFSWERCATATFDALVNW